MRRAHQPTVARLLETSRNNSMLIWWEQERIHDMTALLKLTTEYNSFIVYVLDQIAILKFCQLEGETY